MTEVRDGVAVCHATLHVSGVRPASFGPRLDGAVDAVTGGKAVALDSTDSEVPRRGRQRVYALVGPCDEPAEQSAFRPPALSALPLMAALKTGGTWVWMRA